MVGVKGLEPSTSRSQTARASQLRHTPIVYIAIFWERTPVLYLINREKSSSYGQILENLL